MIYKYLYIYIYKTHKKSVKYTSLHVLEAHSDMVQSIPSVSGNHFQSLLSNLSLACVRMCISVFLVKSSKQHSLIIVFTLVLICVCVFFRFSSHILVVSVNLSSQHTWGPCLPAPCWGATPPHPHSRSASGLPDEWRSRLRECLLITLH